MSSGDDDLKNDVRSFTENARFDRTADYVIRGRAHAKLEVEPLIENWKRAFRAMAKDPFSPNLRQAESDLQAEIDLRGQLIPALTMARAMLEIQDAADEFIAGRIEAVERRRANPEEHRRANEQLLKDIAEFKARRDRPKN
jgi:hypothetical protein